MERGGSGCAPLMCPWPFCNLEINNRHQGVGILLVGFFFLLRGDSDGKSCSIYYPEEN